MPNEQPKDPGLRNAGDVLRIVFSPKTTHISPVVSAPNQSATKKKSKSKSKGGKRRKTIKRRRTQKK